MKPDRDASPDCRAAGESVILRGCGSSSRRCMGSATTSSSSTPPAARSAPRLRSLRRLADRRTGIGFDQALVLEPPRRAGHRRLLPHLQRRRRRGRAVRQRRALHRALVARAHRPSRAPDAARTAPAASSTRVMRDDGLVSVDDGRAGFRSARRCRSRPRAEADELSASSLRERDRRVRRRLDRQSARGDPGAHRCADAPVDTVGPAMENHARFPRRVNVGFMEIVVAGAHPAAGIRARRRRDAGLRHRRLRRGRGRPPARPARRRGAGRRAGRTADRALAWTGEPIWLTGPAETCLRGAGRTAGLRDGGIRMNKQTGRAARRDRGRRRPDRGLPAWRTRTSSSAMPACSRVCSCPISAAAPPSRWSSARCSCCARRTRKLERQLHELIEDGRDQRR